MNGRQRKSLWIAFGVVLVLAAAGALVADERQEARIHSQDAKMARDLSGQAERIDRQRTRAELGICERVKADRLDAARAMTAVALFLEARLISGDLSRVEAKLAAQAFKQTHESANQMRMRLFHCRPLIRRDRERLDQNALREARGEL